MARTLHEDVAGIDLYIPTSYDYFSILPTATPNSQPALRVAPNTDVRAFAPAPTMTPNIFKQRSYGWSFSCWFRNSSSDNQGLSSFRLENNLTNGTIGVNFPMDFSAGYHSSSGGTIFSMRYWGASGTTSWSRQWNAGNTWQFVAFMHPAAGQQAYSIIARVDGGIFGMEQAFTTHGVVASGSDTYATDLKFALGRYSDNVGIGQQYPNKDYAKMAFHNHLLTMTECHMLYQAMF